MLSNRHFEDVFSHFGTLQSPCRLLRGTALLAVATTVLAVGNASAQSMVDLRLVGPAAPIIPGQIFDVKLRVTRQDLAATASLVAVDCIVGWNPAHLRFVSITGAGSIPLASSYLPTPAVDYTGINEIIPPADGNLLYYALTPLGAPRAVPEAGVQIVTFRFESIGLFTTTSIDVIDNLNILYPTETVVYDGVVPGVDDFGIGYSATITQLDCSTIFWYRDSDGDGAGDPDSSTTGCTQPAGFVSSSNDRCPTNAALLEPLTYYADADQDGFGAVATATPFCETSAPAGYLVDASDCDDAAVQYADGDGDGIGAGAMVACGGVAQNTDCNDGSALVYPGAVENCANLAVDNDCDSVASDAEAIDSLDYFVDGDSDGFGFGAATKSCSAIAGSVLNSIDCNDASVIFADLDGDSFGSTTMVACDGVALSTDCNDSSALVYPGAVENCANLAVDNDCDSVATDAEAIDSLDYFVDGDSDLFGAGVATKSCSAIVGSVLDSTDCNDSSALVYPGAVENCANLAVDNDCDGSTLEEEATDRLTFYADLDGDGAGDALDSALACSAPLGYVSVAGDNCPNTPSRLEPVTWFADQDGDGAGDPTSTQDACDQPANFVSVAGDNCPNTPSRLEPVTWYGDADADGVGDGAVVQSACDQPAGFVLTSGDGCPTDSNKLAPGACGCGVVDSDSDSDGNPDCFGQVAALSLVADQVLYAANEQVLVRVNLGASGTGLRAADLSVLFDASRLELVSASPVAGGAFSIEGAELIDNVAGSLRLNLQVPVANAANTAATALADLVFSVRVGATFCSVSNLVGFGAVDGAASSLTTSSTVPMVPTTSSLGAISLLALPPTFGAMTADFAGAADAGTTLGAFVAESTVTASDYCGGVASVSLLATYPDASTSTAWPVGGMFPVGVTTLAWTATDAVGQTAVASRTVTIADYQLLDLSVDLFGFFTQTSTRTIRVKVGASTQLFEVSMVAGRGSIPSIAVPVAAEHACLLVKDANHSVSKSAAATVVGARYSASAQLKQGDSNDDDLIDILDFGNFVGARGLDPTRRAASNFNSDLVVNNGDFSFIGLNFLSVGETCGGFDGPGEPRSRISVRELRRRGLGHMAKADFNRDGWVDTADMAIFLQNSQ